MKFFSSLLFFLTLSCLDYVFAAPSTKRSSQSTANPGADVEKREAIKEAFLFNYKNYVQYAFPQDCIDLKLLQGSVDGATAGFGGTPIESLSTMILMNLTDSDYYKDAIKLIRNQSFYTTNSSIVDGQPGTVKLYELTIRLIGGMLSAFQMNGEKPEEAFLINKTQTLADRIKGSWYKGAKLPVSVFNMQKQTPYYLNDDTNIAEAGSQTIEFSQLSSYTNDQEYVRLAEGSVDTIRNLPQFFPGLPFTRIHPINLTTDSKYVTLGGGFDSYLEYLIKYPLLLGQRDHRFVETWTNAIESVEKYLTVKTGINNFTFPSDYDANKNTTVFLSSHLACFLGGNIAMGGRVLGNDRFKTLGLELSESCAATYDQTKLGLGPYGFGYADPSGNFTGWNFVSSHQREFYNQHGIFVSVGYWFVAPEVIESVFYAWRITGHQMWRDVAWKIFLQIKKVADTGHGFAIIQNVNDESSGIQGPQPPFLYSETLKYLYLIFDDSQRYSLDDIVFNTEGMAFKRKQSNGFKPVQGNYPYTPLYYGKSSSDYETKENGKNAALQASKLVLTNTVKPPNIHDAKAGASKIEFAKQMTSYTNMPQQVALDFLQRMV